TTPTCTSTYAAGTPVASSPVAITCSGGAASANYTVSYTAGDVTIGTRAITVKADAYGGTLAYGDAEPSFTAYSLTSGSLYTGDTFTTAPSCDSDYDQGDPAGTYTITCSGGAITNSSSVVVTSSYTLSYAPRALVVAAATTTTTITSDSDPSVTGASYSVAGTVVIATTAKPIASGDLPGTVSVSDDEGTPNTCSDSTLAFDSDSGSGSSTYLFSCSLASTTAGSKTLTATYADPSPTDFATSSDTESHTVDAASTTTTITSDSPDPSTAGDAYTVSGTVSVTSPGNGPGSGNLPGSVTVSDGTDTCTDSSVAYASANTYDFSCSLTSTTAGSKTLTATYADPTPTDFATSSDTENHTVEPVATSTIYTGQTYDADLGTESQLTVSVTVGNEACFTGSTATATVTPLGGSALPLVSLSGPSGSGTTRTFSASPMLAAGIYEIDITFTPAAACAPSSYDDAVLTVVGAGQTANGGGWYRNSRLPNGSPRINFGFSITRTMRSGIAYYRGRLLWMNNGQWRIAGSISSDGSPAAYGLLPSCPTTVGTATDRKCASFTGSGVLQYWDGATGTWQTSTYGVVTFTVTVYDGGTSKVCNASGKKCSTVQNPDWFGIQFDPVPSSAIREGLPIQLSGGSIKAS
ncbi:MAG: hypothetical protein ACKO8G_07280, partial [Actinomycetota bacterium]